MRIEYHRTLIGDRVRNQAFEAALKALITPGETIVADIGAGTGYLGLLAARLGAKEVYLYESGPVAGVAEAVLACNKARNCHLLPFASYEMDAPPKVDLVVSETLGNYPLEEDIVATINDALRRHLRPGGQVIPRGISQFVAPVVSPRWHDELSVWRSVHPDIDFAPAEQLSRNNVYVRKIEASGLMAGGESAVVWDRLDLTRQNRSSRKGVARWTIARSETIYGFASWWQVDLVPGLVLSTAPWAPATHWEQLYFPIASPLEVVAGEHVQLSLRSRSTPEAGTHLAWTATVETGSGTVRTRHVHDLDRGYIP
jgi:SAM-dependent methyltransferase